MADGGEQVIAGFLMKKGEPGTGFLGMGGTSWKLRYIVVDRGQLTFYKSEADYEQRKPPVKNRIVPLRLYAVCKGPDEDPRSFCLRPIPEDTAEGRERKERGDGDYVRNSDGSARLFELRSVEIADRNDWINVFVEDGCMSEDEYTKLTKGRDKPAVAPAPPSSAEPSSD
jgi:hypothetical protein